jgi:hypothetical protein
MGEVKDTLKERGENYGEFLSQARITQALKHVARATPGWNKMRADNREALDMIFHKIARILNGNPDYADSWHDIQGYARLVEERIQNETEVEKLKEKAQEKLQAAQDIQIIGRNSEPTNEE